MKATTTKKIVSVITGILFSALFAITLISCGQIAENSDSSQEVTVNLPNLTNGSSRSISRDDIGRLERDTRKYRVIFQTSGGTTVVREGTGGTFSASFAMGVEISVTVECLNGNDEVIVRTVAKTLKVGDGQNSLSFNLSEDGTEVITPTPGPTPPAPGPTPPQPVPGTVTYADGGSNVSNMPSDPASYNENEDVALKTTEPTRPGYDFTGWTTAVALSANDSSGGEIPISPNATFASGSTQISGITKITSFKMPAGGVVLTAQWSPKTYILTLNPNHNDGGPQPSQQQPNVTADSMQALQTLSRTGYTFAGYTATQSSQPNDTKYTTIAQLQADIRNGAIGTSGSTIELYAQWSPTPYTITYNANGGQISQPGTNSFTINDTNITFSVATRAGYEFANWRYTNETGIDAFENATILIEKASGTTVSLIAQWQELDTLYVDADSGNDTSGDGTGSNPFATLKKAFDVARALSGEKTIELQTDITLTAAITNNGSGVTYTIKSADTVNKKTIRSTSSYRIQGSTDPIILENLRIVSERNGGAVISQILNGIQLKNTTIETDSGADYSAGFSTSASIVMEGSSTVDKIKLFSTSYIEIKGTLSTNPAATLVIDSSSSSNPINGTTVLKGDVDVDANYTKFKVTDENGNSWGTINNQGILHKN